MVDSLRKECTPQKQNSSQVLESSSKQKKQLQQWYHRETQSSQGARDPGKSCQLGETVNASEL
jgi:hypothetical protein